MINNISSNENSCSQIFNYKDFLMLALISHLIHRVKTEKYLYKKENDNGYHFKNNNSFSDLISGLGHQLTEMFDSKALNAILNILLLFQIKLMTFFYILRYFFPITLIFEWLLVTVWIMIMVTKIAIVRIRPQMESCCHI